MPEPTPQASGLKRRATDDEDDRQSKRLRSDDDSFSRSRPLQATQPSGNFLEVSPEEVRAKIFNNLVDVNDVISTLENIKSWKQASKTLYKTAEFVTNKDILKNIQSVVKTNVDVLDSFAYENKDGDRAALRLLSLESDADFLPLVNADRRSQTAADILKYSDSDFPHQAYDNLISNIDFLKKGEHSAIAKRVCKYQEEKGISDNLICKLIDKADVLGPEEHELLLTASCKQPVTIDQRAILDCWATKMGVLSKNNQRRVISNICEGDEGRTKSLIYFSEHINDVHPEVRSELARPILSLPDGEPGKSEALSHLAEHLGSFKEEMYHEITSAVIHNIDIAHNEPFDSEEQAWYSKPRFCAIEGVHYLGKHKNILIGKDRDRVESLIDSIMEKQGRRNRSEQIQLVSHMVDDKRVSAFNQIYVPNDNGIISPKLLYAVAARVEDLSRDEKSSHVSFLLNLPESEVSSELIDYNICNNLKAFEPDHISGLVNRRLENAAFDDPAFAGAAIADIARNAALLRSTDIASTIETARRIVEANLREDSLTEEARASVRACYREAARCLATWCDPAIVKAQDIKTTDYALQQKQLARASENRDRPSPGQRERSPAR